MRWNECHICGIEDEVRRDDGSNAQVYECWCCWEDYCEKDGSIHTRICNECLNKAYEANEKIILLNGGD